MLGVVESTELANKGSGHDSFVGSGPALLASRCYVVAAWELVELCSVFKISPTTKVPSFVFST